MKTKTFEIPVDSMVEFAELLEEHDLTGEITGTNSEDEIVVVISYEPSEREAVFDITEWYENSELEEVEEED
jgi:hypothetical protein